MFLRYTKRKKNGKEHRYWSIVENKRGAGGSVVQRHVLYLGEINDRQEATWQKSIEIFADGEPQPRTVALFPDDRALEAEADAHLVRVRLSPTTIAQKTEGPSYIHTPPIRLHMPKTFGPTLAAHQRQKLLPKLSQSPRELPRSKARLTK